MLDRMEQAFPGSSSKVVLSELGTQTVTPADPRLWGFDGYDVASGEYRNDTAYREVKKTAR